jgi:hypothetical protein
MQILLQISCENSERSEVGLAVGMQGRFDGRRIGSCSLARAAIAMAERTYGTADRLDPAGMS